MLCKEYASGDAIGMQQGYEQVGAWPTTTMEGGWVQKMTVFVEDRTKRPRFKRNDQI